MIAVYCIAIFCYIFYFGIGYKRFHTDTYKIGKIGLGCSAILLRLFCLKFGAYGIVSYINIGIDLLIGALIYLLMRHYASENKSLIGASFYLLNPVVVIYSCVWNMSLSLWMLLIILGVWYGKKKKVMQTCICFSIALYLYFGTVFLLPLFVIVIRNRVRKKLSSKRSIYVIRGVLVPFAMMFILESVILKKELSCLKVLKHIFSNQRMSYNACNFWAMIGWNWKEITLNADVNMLIGICSIILLIMGTLYFINKLKESKSCYLVTAFLIYCYGYFFGVGNNEYLFLPIILLSLGCFLVNGSKKTYWIFLGASILGFCNQIYTCSLYHPESFNNLAPALILFSLCTLIGLIVVTKYLLTEREFWMIGQEQGEDMKNMEAGSKNKMQKGKQHKQTLEQVFQAQKLEVRDYLAIGVLTIVFIALSLPRLGSHVAPKTTYEMSEDTNREIILDLGEEKYVDHLEIFLGQEHEIKVHLSSYVNNEWNLLGDEQTVKSVFAWNEVPLSTSLRYLGIVVSNKEAYFNEMVIVSTDGEIIEPINAQEYSTLFDEQELYKAYPTYYDQTFFDEVYHARTAYEYIIGDTSYENTHPPLGKILISIGIRIFGMNPFGWRIVVEVFGILMIPLMYLFSKRLFNSFWAATMTTLLLTMDFMHFTLAKIATLDIIIGFFILLMYYFMYWYCQQDFMKEPLKKSFIPLGLCGITMGVGVATKWTGAYAGAGLAILFFTHILEVYINNKEEKNVCVQKIVKTFAFCVMFFIIIPISIYCLSYIPFVGYREYNGLLDKVIDNMQSMYNYHSNLEATHPYESWWYQWAWMKRPLFQAASYRPDGMGSVINCFGNPLVWWPSIFAAFYIFKCWMWEHDKKAGFLCISYAAQLIPWMFVTRNTFIYHYFPSSLFSILMSGYCMHKIMTHYRNGKKIVWLYGGLVILVFAMFYPVISGIWIDKNMASQWLRWLSSWQII